MAVYTELHDRELADFIAGFDIGDVISCDGIAEGIENSNFRLTTEAGRFILTLYEARVDAQDLPFFLSLMEHLSDQGLPCPVPVRAHDGRTLHSLCGRPAAIVTFLAGDWPRAPTPDHCRALGRAAAELHLAGRNFAMSRPNDLSIDAWRPMLEPLRDRAEEIRPGFGDWLAGELSQLEDRWPTGLPSGIIHADLFPDNVFFVDGSLSGIIDFYFACNDYFAYDLAVCLNAWCFERDGTFSPERSAALFAGYGSIRQLDTSEAAAMPVLARGAAMRFLLTRLHDWFKPARGPLTSRKDPLAFVPIIAFHRKSGDAAIYGIDLTR